MISFMSFILPYAIDVSLGDSLILILAAVAKSFQIQCVLSAMVLIIFLILFMHNSDACAMVPFCVPSITC